MTNYYQNCERLETMFNEFFSNSEFEFKSFVSFMSSFGIPSGTNFGYVSNNSALLSPESNVLFLELIEVHLWNLCEYSIYGSGHTIGDVFWHILKSFIDYHYEPKSIELGGEI